MLRVHRIAHSTNVVRVALAAGHKGLQVEWVDHDPGDRSAVRAVSGQDLVPVMEVDGEVVTDSMRIVARLEELAPEPPLFPADPAARAATELFIEWFDHVWKGPPNEIEAELRSPSPDRRRIAALAARLAGRQRWFEGLLTGGPYLLGDDFTAADVCAYPFLAYAAGRPPGDEELFHQVLDDCLQLDGFPHLSKWIARVADRPVA